MAADDADGPSLLLLLAPPLLLLVLRFFEEEEAVLLRADDFILVFVRGVSIELLLSSPLLHVILPEALAAEASNGDGFVRGEVRRVMPMMVVHVLVLAAAGSCWLVPQRVVNCTNADSDSDADKANPPTDDDFRTLVAQKRTIVQTTGDIYLSLLSSLARVRSRWHAPRSKIF